MNEWDDAILAALFLVLAGLLVAAGLTLGEWNP